MLSSYTLSVLLISPELMNLCINNNIEYLEKYLSLIELDLQYLMTIMMNNSSLQHNMDSFKIIKMKFVRLSSHIKIIRECIAFKHNYSSTEMNKYIQDSIYAENARAFYSNTITGG